MKWVGVCDAPAGGCGFGKRKARIVESEVAPPFGQIWARFGRSGAVCQCGSQMRRVSARTEARVLREEGGAMLEVVGPKRGEWWAIGLDVTRHYNVADEDRPHIRRIIDTFMYDRSEVTHCCEITPSYWLIYLHTEIEWQGEPSEEIRERIDERYAHEETDDMYVHCAEVEGAKELHIAYGEPATEDEAREYWQGNYPF